VDIPIFSTAYLCCWQGSFPETLESAVNSVVCTDDGSSSLLVDLFHMTPKPVQPIRFPPDQCRSAARRCDQCLAQPRCRFTGISHIISISISSSIIITPTVLWYHKSNWRKWAAEPLRLRLPTDVVVANSLSTFRRQLKCYLFWQSYSDIVYWHYPSVVLRPL